MGGQWERGGCFWQTVRLHSAVDSDQGRRNKCDGRIESLLDTALQSLDVACLQVDAFSPDSAEQSPHCRPTGGTLLLLACGALHRTLYRECHPTHCIGFFSVSVRLFIHNGVTEYLKDWSMLELTEV